MKTLLAVLLLAILAPLTSRAAINFSTGVNPNDLVISITEDIVFTFNVGYSGQSAALVLPNTVPSSAPELNRNTSPTLALTFKGKTNIESRIYQTFFGGDLLLLYIYNAPFSVSINDTFTIPAGTYTAAGWFNNGGVMPSSPTSGYMMNELGNPVTPTQAVPEPSAMVMAALGFSLCLGRRRK